MSKENLSRIVVGDYKSSLMLLDIHINWNGPKENNISSLIKFFFQYSQTINGGGKFNYKIEIKKIKFGNEKKKINSEKNMKEILQNDVRYNFNSRKYIERVLISSMLIDFKRKEICI
jgi:hypothetical protein